MEDIFFIPKRKMSYDDIIEIINKAYPECEISVNEAIYVNLIKEGLYFEVYELPKDEIESMEEEQPKFWQKVQPFQIFSITHKSARFDLIKPLLNRLLAIAGGHFCLLFNDLYDLKTIDQFNY